jgi:hypothetical protein
VAKPDISRLLIDSALRPELRRRLAEAPDGVFEEYDLTAEERDILRSPDHRLLPLLGMALARREEAKDAASKLADEAENDVPQVPSGARMLPDSLIALTVVPCAVKERIAYAVWVTPMQEGGDPSRLPAPAGATLPGRPLNPLHAVIQISAAQERDAAGNLQIGMWASFRQCSNAVTPPPAESAGNPAASPFGSPLDSLEARAAAAEVHAAAPADRYEKLVTLTRALRRGDVR